MLLTLEFYHRHKHRCFDPELEVKSHWKTFPLEAFVELREGHYIESRLEKHRVVRGVEVLLVQDSKNVLSDLVWFDETTGLCKIRAVLDMHPQELGK